MRVFLLFLVISFGNIATLYSQFGGRSSVNILVQDKANRSEILVGAHVRICSGGDTIVGTTTKFDMRALIVARFNVDKSFKDSVDLHVSYLGYKPFHKRYSAQQFAGPLFVGMEQDEVVMSQIVVVGNSIAMVIKGDTTVYNSAAFKTMEGDRFSELLKQLPGIEIKDNKIYASGEEIKRVYVDGKNMFGTNTSYTLTDIEASDVKNVKVYEEENPTAKRMDDKTALKDRVMDVVTHSKRKSINGGSIKLAAGASLEKDYSGKRELRHSGDLTAYRNNEKGSFRLNASNYKNDGQKEYASLNSKMTPSQRTNANLTHEYRRGDSTTISTTLSMYRHNNERIESTFTEYFPTDDYKKRVTESLSDAISESWSARASNYITLARKKNTFRSNIDFSIDKSKNRSGVDATQQIDDEKIHTQTHNNADARNMTFNARLDYMGKLSEKSSIDLGAAINHSERKSDGWNIDTLASSTGLRVLLNNDANGRNTDISASGEFKRQLNDNSSLVFRYSYDHTYNKSKQMSIDYLDQPQGTVDEVNSYDYTINSDRNTVSTEWRYRKERNSIRAGVRGVMYNVNMEERLPIAGDSPHTFFMLNPFANLSFGTMQKRWYLGMGSNSNVISVEMLRNSLDSSNPMYLNAGNADLRPSNNAYFNARYFIQNAKESASLSLHLNGGYTFNYIAPKRTFFAQDTYLPQYDYTAQKGAQLTSNVNVKGNYNLGAGINIGKRIALLKSTINASINYSYRQTPYYVGEDLLKSYNHEAEVGLGIYTGFSKNIRLNLNSDTGLGYYQTNKETTRYIRESINGSVDVQFAKKYFVFMKTAYEMYANDKASVATQHNVIANAALGRKFGKENHVSLSLGVVDMFNRTSYISTILNSDYIRTSTTSYLGRYGYLMFSITF